MAETKDGLEGEKNDPADREEEDILTPSNFPEFEVPPYSTLGVLEKLKPGQATVTLTPCTNHSNPQTEVTIPQPMYRVGKNHPPRWWLNPRKRKAVAAKISESRKGKRIPAEAMARALKSRMENGRFHEAMERRSKNEHWRMANRRWHRTRRGKPALFGNPVARGKKISATWNTPEGKEKRKLLSKAIWANKTPGQRRIWANEISKALTGIKRGPLSEEHRRKVSQHHKMLYRLGLRKLGGPNGWHRHRYKSVLFRSTWEVTFAQWCDDHKLVWRYEPRRFDILGATTYTPDFYLPQLDLWVEIKGYRSPEFLSKFRWMAELYPNVRIVIVDGTGLRNIDKVIGENL